MGFWAQLFGNILAALISVGILVGTLMGAFLYCTMAFNKWVLLGVMAGLALLGSLPLIVYGVTVWLIVGGVFMAIGVAAAFGKWPWPKAKPMVEMFPLSMVMSALDIVGLKDKIPEEIMDSIKDVKFPIQLVQCLIFPFILLITTIVAFWPWGILSVFIGIFLIFIPLLVLDCIFAGAFPFPEMGEAIVTELPEVLEQEAEQKAEDLGQAAEDSAGRIATEKVSGGGATPNAQTGIGSMTTMAAVAAPGGAPMAAPGSAEGPDIMEPSGPPAGLAEAKAEEEALETQLEGAAGREKAAREQATAEAGTAEGDEAEKEAEEAHEEVEEDREELEKETEEETKIEKGAKEDKKEKGAKVAGAGGGFFSKNKKWLIPVGIFLVIFIALWIVSESNSAWATKINLFMGPIKSNLIAALQWLKVALMNLIFGMVKKIMPQSVMGVPIADPFKFKSCYPFCISEGGQNVKWNGLEISQLNVIPASIYDYQRFNLLLEFKNAGGAPATFTPPSSGGVELGTVEQCRWRVDPVTGTFTLDVLIGGDLRTCNENEIINMPTGLKPYASGGCDITNPDGTLKEDTQCTLAPEDVLRLTWYGIKVHDDMTQLGDVVEPEITVDIRYKYVPTTDVVGHVSVMSAETQVAAMEAKSIGRIANLVSESYSPLGPLMLAMGTAEEQVFAGQPTLMMVQFQNKGTGTLEKVNKDLIRLYVPKEFVLMGDQYCDFEAVVDGGVGPWYPGPGFEDHVVYKVGKDTKDIGPIEPMKAILDTPILGCIFRAPDKPGIKAYDFKLRMQEYDYKETKKTKVRVIGTDLALEEGKLGWNRIARGEHGDRYLGLGVTGAEAMVMVFDQSSLLLRQNDGDLAASVQARLDWYPSKAAGFTTQKIEMDEMNVWYLSVDTRPSDYPDLVPYYYVWHTNTTVVEVEANRNTTGTYHLYQKLARLILNGHPSTME